MEISLNKDSVVNQQTGEVSAPAEYLENLRAIERAIAAHDDRIDALKAELKHERESREICVQQLRAAVRDGTVLPLFEMTDPPATDGNSDDDGWEDDTE